MSAALTRMAQSCERCGCALEQCECASGPVQPGHSDRFRIRFADAIIDGVEKRIRPWQATKDLSPRCPECSETVVLRLASRDESGAVVRSQLFAHYPRPDGSESTCEGGSGESYIHNTAKKLVLQAIAEWMTGEGPCPLFVFRCRPCGEIICRYLPFLPVFVECEHVLPSGLKPDVFVAGSSEDEDGGLGVIEVFKTHAIEDEKIDEYASLSWWVEIEADPVLEDPSEWIVRRSSFGAQSCPDCLGRAVRKLLEKEAEVQDRIEDMEDRLSGERSAVEAMRIEVRGLERQKEDVSDGLHLLDKLKAEARAATKAAQSLAAISQDAAAAAKKLCDDKNVELSATLCEMGIVRDEVRSLDDVRRLRSEIESLRVQIPRKQEELKSLQAAVAAAQAQRKAKETEDERYAYWQKLVTTAARRDYKAGWVAYRYKDRYGDWPPNEWGHDE